MFSHNHVPLFTTVRPLFMLHVNETSPFLPSAPPDPPTNIQVESCIGRRARISWTPGNSNLRRIDHYYVEYNHSFAPNVWKRSAPVELGKTEAEVKLSPHANYTFRLVGQKYGVKY